MIEKRLKELLLADTTVTSIIDDRITPVVLRVDVATPCLVYRRLGSQPEYTLAGRAGWRTVVDQIICWTNDYGRARDLAEAVRKCLDAYTEDETQGSIRFISVADGADEYQGDLDLFGAVCVATIDYDDEAVTL